ncbi:hypothetical protein [Pseudomonas sp. SCB32]|uniref:hypothetical protein n=1 Tax=Pseudomonas sp. SCB32 TaxID=2653853 RepID=UPI00126599AF|nr:hypothetical protein [Pseudomonas sp. SCB32]
MPTSKTGYVAREIARHGYVGQALVDTELRTADEKGNDTDPDQPGKLLRRQLRDLELSRRTTA